MSTIGFQRASSIRKKIEVLLFGIRSATIQKVIIRNQGRENWKVKKKEPGKGWILFLMFDVLILRITIRPSSN